MNRSFCSLLFLLLLLPSLSVLAEGDRGSDRLAEIEAEVEKETNQLVRLQKQIATLESDLRASEVELASLRKRERNTGDELRKVMQERDLLVAELARLKFEFTQLSEVSAARVRALYMGQRRDSSRPDIAAIGEGTLQKIAYYSNTVQASDREMLLKLARAAENITEKTAQLSELVNNRNQIKAKLTEERKKIATHVETGRAVIKEIQQREKKLSLTVTALRAQALRLETVVASLTQGRGPEFYSHNSALPPARSPVAAPEFEGQGLEKIRGKLVLPVTDAKLKKRFGKQKLGGFKDFVFSKGMEFETAIDSPVKAVAAGRVMYSGRMPGYGTILILDHGKRSYSLYGQLGKILAKKGQPVSADEDIARVATIESSGTGQMYFEIRKNGKPVDPATYYNGSVKLPGT